MPTDATTGAYTLPNDPATNIVVNGFSVADPNALRSVTNDIAAALNFQLSRRNGIQIPTAYSNLGDDVTATVTGIFALSAVPQFILFTPTNTNSGASPRVRFFDGTANTAYVPIQAAKIPAFSGGEIQSGVPYLLLVTNTAATILFSGAFL